MIKLFLASLLAFGQQFCPSLESITFATNMCVPTTRELCHSGQPGNCEVRQQTVTCKYVRGSGVHIFQVPQQRGFECIANGPQDCSGGTPENPQCTQGPCLKYSPPLCRQDCKKCYEDSVTEQQPIKGCQKFCAEESCQDEPRCDPDPCKPGEPCNQNSVCDRKRIPGATPQESPFILPVEKLEICQADLPCPTAPVAVDSPYNSMDQSTCFYRNGSPCQFTPDGKVIPEVNGPTECTKTPIQEDTSTFQNDSCPWIDYEKRQPVCAPVTVGNRFPQDCRECTGNSSSKVCNIPASRCP